MSDLEQLNRTIVACDECPRLVEYRRQVGERKRRMYMDWGYWARQILDRG